MRRAALQKLEGEMGSRGKGSTLAPTSLHKWPACRPPSHKLRVPLADDPPPGICEAPDQLFASPDSWSEEGQGDLATRPGRLTALLRHCRLVQVASIVFWQPPRDNN
eukprot:15444807-Alexandrium_andersonii.AAC.4